MEDFKGRVLGHLNQVSDMTDWVHFAGVPGAGDVHQGPRSVGKLSGKDRKLLDSRGDIKPTPWRDEEFDVVKFSPQDMAARDVAMDIYEQLGLKVGQQDWELARFPDGSEAFMPKIMVDELAAALDRATGKLGASYKTGIMPGDTRRTFATREGVEISSEPENLVKARALVGTVVGSILDFFPRMPGHIKQGITTGFLYTVNSAYYTGVSIGGMIQMYQALGAEGTLMALRRPGFAGAVTAAMFSDGIAIPWNRPVVDRFGRIYTVEEVTRMAEAEGLNNSLIKSETASSMERDIARLDNTRTNKILSKAWFTNEMLIETATAIDNFYRVSTFVDRLSLGEAPAQAAEIARKALLDYNDLTDVEKAVCRNVVMFYSYIRKNIDLTWDTMLDNPSRILGQVRLMRGLKKEFFQDEAEIVENEWTVMRMPFYFSQLAVVDLHASSTCRRRSRTRTPSVWPSRPWTWPPKSLTPS